MQMIKILSSILTLTGLSITCFALPPFQVLRTCIDVKPFNDAIEINELDGDGYADKSLKGCEDQYGRTFKGHVYGSLTCNDKFYLIVNDKKVDPELADNRSINPEIKPGEEFTTRAVWYKIDYENNEYLCIRSPLAEQGVGAAYHQYYIVENAFDENLHPELYFYFLDKNIAPINSNAL